MYAKTLIFFCVAIGASLAATVPAPLAPNVTCVPVENIVDITPDVKRDFFGKVGINANTEVQLVLALKNGTTTKISFDDDVRNANSSLGVDIVANAFTVYVRTAGKNVNLRTGTHALKYDKNFTLDVHIIETGPNFNKYAFVVYMNGNFWFVIEEQPKVEVLYSNYITITGASIKSVSVCPEESFHN